MMVTCNMRKIIDNLYYMAAIELMHAAQAVGTWRNQRLKGFWDRNCLRSNACSFFEETDSVLRYRKDV